MKYAQQYKYIDIHACNSISMCIHTSMYIYIYACIHMYIYISVYIKCMYAYTLLGFAKPAMHPSMGP